MNIRERNPKTACIFLLLILLLCAHSIPFVAATQNVTNNSAIAEKISNFAPEPFISEKAIRIGVLANRGYDIAMQEWVPTAEYLSKELAPAQFIIVPLDFNETTESVREKNVSFICANPSVYTYLEYYGLAQRIATLQVPGDPDPQAVFGGVIFTRSDRDNINKLSDLQGKRFAAVDPTSLGGWHAAWAELLKAGIQPDRDLSSLNFTKTHDAAVMAVLSGAADAGTVRSTQIERMAKEGKINLSDIKVLNNQKDIFPNYPYLLSTPLYPEWPFASVTGTDHFLSKEVSIALLMMDQNDPAAKVVRGAGWAVPQDHTTVHELLRHLNLPPYETYGKPTLEQVINQYWQSILAIIVGIIILSILLLYTLRTKEHLKTALTQVRESEIAIRKSKEDLEQVHAELAETQDRILDSIYYAKLIQQSILPPKADLEKHLKEYFSIFKPLDIVGGDFYLLKKTHDGFVIAVADCTGHGVPGAFMTMMASALLTRVIETNPYDTPASLLIKLHLLLQETLKAQSDKKHLENGLDISLCRVYSDQNTLLFAGGGLPLIFVEDGSVREISGERLHLGFSQIKRNFVFTDHQVVLKQDAQYYLITDGILDLPGGGAGHGLGRNKFMALIKSLSTLPMHEQKKELLHQLTIHQGQWISKDDMTIIGFIIR